jgi:acetyl-CoA carboxylase carboxyltransferase component
MGGPEALDRHRSNGRLPVRERIERLIEPGSWCEVGLLALPELRRAKPVPGDAVVTGYGTVGGRRAAIIGIDATVVAGSTAPISMRKQGNLIAQAQRWGWPLVLLCDADGGRIPDVMGWRFSGLPLDFTTFLETPEGQAPIPRAAAILGPSYGDSALHASTAHFVVMVRSGSVALSGPSVIESAIGETVSDVELGGPEAAEESGIAHLVVDDEDDAMAAIEAFLSYLPSNASLEAPIAPPQEPVRPPSDLEHIVPAETRSAYDVHHVIDAIADGRSVLPWAGGWGTSLVTVLARIEGKPVGILANQPLVRAGALDPPALAKARRFVELCDTFNVPLVFLQDVPGLMIGTQAERAGILHAYEALVARTARCAVPRISIILRKAYGGGHFAMGGRPTHPDFLYAWPTAEMGFMAPDTGVRTVHRRELQRVLAEEGQEAHDHMIDKLVSEWATESRPWEAAAHLSLDDIIEPARTREVIATSIDLAWGPKPVRVARGRS